MLQDESTKHPTEEFLSTLQAESAKAQAFWHESRLHWAQQTPEIRTKLLLDGLKKLRGCISVFGKPKRDYDVVLAYVDEMIEGQIYADAMEVASLVHRIKAAGQLPVIAGVTAESEYHWIEWTGIFRRTKREMAQSETTQQWLGADTLRRIVVINERLRTFALTYLSTNGWDKDFVPAFEAYQQRSFAKARATPPWEPIPG
jgi:hypothetical protein